MKGIVALSGPNGKRHLFWLNTNLEMMASSPEQGFGFNLNLGGIFTSLPAVVLSMARNQTSVTNVVENENVGGTTAVEGINVINTNVLGNENVIGGENAGGTGNPLLTQRIDIFGIGLDYSMYYKTLWGNYSQNDTSPWSNLGGIFTSSPAAIYLPGDRVDVFGVGLDHELYTKSRTGEGWTPDWISLGGTFTSTPSIVTSQPNKIHLFIRGHDFTLRHNQYFDSSWFGWQNLGGDLASAPVAFGWETGRLDVFAIFKNGALWHTWWDGQIWNEWESLGGVFIGEPAVTSCGPGRLDVFVVAAEDHTIYRYVYSDNTWSLQPSQLDTETVTESPTAISPVQNKIEVFSPSNDLSLRYRFWDGHIWQLGSIGGRLRIPSRYRVSLDLVRANTTRSQNADTDAAATTIAVGNWLPITKTQWIGTIGGTHPQESQTNLLRYESVCVDLAEPMSFSYLIVNNGHASEDDILESLSNAGDSLHLETVSSMTEDIRKGVEKFISVKIAAALTVSVPLVGSILGVIETWLLNKLGDILFENCDGIVAAELPLAMTGRDLFILTDNGKKNIRIITNHHGTDPPGTCGSASEYEVTWSVIPL